VGFALFVFAFFARLISLITAGGFDSVLGYDDGVYYGAATAFVHGLIPYRDFVMVHPPGILLILSPFALLAKFTSDATGFYAARIFFMLIGATSTYLIYRVGRRFNSTTGVVAALIYAVWMPVVRIERTPYLEGIGSLALLIALYLLPKPKVFLNRVALSGAILGFAVATKLWFAVPVVVITIWFVFSREIKRAAIFGATALATFLVVIAPFWIGSQGHFRKLILTAQLNRGGGHISEEFRLVQIFNYASLSFIENQSLRIVIGIALILVISYPFIKYFRKREQGLLILALFLAQLIVLLKTPVFFNAYPSFVAATFALIIGISLGAIHRNLLTALFISTLVAGGFYGTLTQEPGRSLPTVIEQLPLNQSRCVTSDSPAVLALTNTLTKDLVNKCHLIFDVTGTIYGIDNGANPYHRSATSRRLRSEQYQRELKRYLDGGHTIILARSREDGLRPETYYEIIKDRKIIKSKSFLIIEQR
jgi:hypothetical protein